MRFMLLALLTVSCTFAAHPQTLLAKRAFDEATRLANAGDFRTALKNYKAALTADVNESGEFAVKLRYNIGVCYYRTGQLDAAVRELTAVTKLSARHARAYYALGMAESARERWPAARDAFLRALEIDPADGEAWFDLAFVYLAMHDYDRTALAFRRSIEHRSVDAALGHNNLGVIMAVRHEIDAAERAFNAALELDPSLAEARQNLAICKAAKADRRELLAGLGLQVARRPERA